MLPTDAAEAQSIWHLLRSGGFVMWPLLLCSFVSWVVIFERIWTYRRLGHEMRAFHLQALNTLLRGSHSLDEIRRLCDRNHDLPTARLLLVALDRLGAKDSRIRSKWIEAIERSRQLVNHDLKRGLWMLGTIGSSAPFIGLFGTVVGILRAFQEMAHKGSGGFAVVAAGISEALVATAAGIVVAVIAVMSYNAFQTRWSSLIVMIRLHVEEFVEILSSRTADEESEKHGV